MSAAEKLEMYEETQVDRKELMRELFEVRTKIAEIEARELKSLKARKTALENQLLSLLEVGEKLSFADIGTVSCKEEVVPNVSNWDAVYEHVMSNKAFYLLPRKVNAAAYRESLQIGDKIEGIESVAIRKLSVRKA
ncbi:hypothetical protein [Shewanella gaetbuli]|uniref:Uncharacterized protein n=1 Tax=Shewanella gaetbuli TaxID=220752 RepID=A0A9X1ZK22_9GAMM|nr:hypothetical protein [Shewanella gaetbuli]MCL1142946.1 hypothetical protein [Shewanella gaetbuli]